jgi:hypothetical protein
MIDKFERYLSPYRCSSYSGISRQRLASLVNLGVIKAKRVDTQTVLIEWESVQHYLDSLPDATYPEKDAPPETTPQDSMNSFNDQRVKAMDLFSNK